jgi:hypothetical protein
MYSVRMESALAVTVQWGVPAGTHTARWGGSTQAPCGAFTVITPREA